MGRFGGAHVKREPLSRLELVIYFTTFVLALAYIVFVEYVKMRAYWHAGSM